MKRFGLALAVLALSLAPVLTSCQQKPAAPPQEQAPAATAPATPEATPAAPTATPEATPAPTAPAPAPTPAPQK